MRLAAIHYANGGGPAVDALLAQLAHDLKTQGWQLAGSIQINGPEISANRCEMSLTDLATGRVTKTSVHLAKNRSGCRLDSSALEDAAGLAAANVTDSLNLVIVNRFGAQEAAGAGFRAVMDAAVLAGLPLLTSVSAANALAWSAYSGGEAVELAPVLGDVTAWCAGLRSR